MITNTPAETTEHDDDNAVWIVAGNYADDPHPHVLGVYETEEQADDLMDRCRDDTSAPYVDSWDKFRRVVQNNE